MRFNKKKDVNTFYQKHFYSRFSLIEQLKVNLSKRVQTRLLKKNLVSGYRQIAVFSFDAIGLDINYFGVYEKNELDCFFKWLHESNIDLTNSAALDIGANIGNHSLFFSDYVKHVYAFEPHPLTFGLLKFNADLVENITAFNFGLSDAETTAELITEPQNIGASSIALSAAKQKMSNQKKRVSIHLSRLDDLDLSKLPVGLIKIDVEGHEISVLKGAQSKLLQHQPIIIFEQLKHEIAKGSSPSIDFLKTLGYTLYFEPVFSTPLEHYIPTKFKKIVKSLFGEMHQIKRVEQFDNRTYPFIIAMPSRMKSHIKALRIS